MPDKRQPDGPTDSSLNTGSTLIARRNAIRPTFGRGTGGNSTGGHTAAGIADDLTEWLDDNELTTEAVVRMEQIRDTHWNTYKRLMAFVTGNDELRILQALVEFRNGVGYDRLTEYADTSRRTVRRKVKTLADMDVVQRTGNPTLVSFTDKEREFLAVDAAAVQIEF